MFGAQDSPTPVHLIDIDEGVVGPAQDGSKPREVLPE